MCILRNQLRDFGYDLHEEVLQAAEWNALEHRERMCMVAVTRGLAFDFAGLVRPDRREQRIAEILDPVPEDASCWGRMEGLKAKQERDKAEGKGFAMQIVTPFDTKCPTITKGYAKVRSTDPKLQHPSDPDLLRQFTPAEHARIKGIPERLVSGLSATLAHELLGQSICYESFRAVGRLIG
jgi:DNA (cytosine-5)-methyltransferase 1